MKLRALVGAAFAASVLFVGASGCDSGDSDAAAGVHCTPGSYVFCRCQDRAEGTKLCNADGASFQACSTGRAGACPDGEDASDPDAGKPVAPPGATTPAPAPAPDAALQSCPGKPTPITPGAELVIDGDTTAAKSIAQGRAGACAAGAGGPDHIYRLQPTGSGSLRIAVQGELALDALFYLRTTCADEATEIACAPPRGPSSRVELTTNVASGRDYFLVVDGASATAGKYQLTTKLTAASFCGDGKVDAGEACDDGNDVDDDGCAKSCAGISGDPASGGSCAGHPVHVWPGQSVTGTGSTLPFGNTFTKTGSACDPSGDDPNVSNDHVYAVTAHAAGTLNVTLTPTDAAFDAMLVARKTCADPASQGAGMCANDGSAGAAEEMSFAVTSGQTVFVAVDGVLGGKGAYAIRFDLPQ